MTWDSLRLARLPAGAKLMVTLFLLIVGPGYLFGIGNIFFKHRNADGDEKLTINDIRATFHGIPAPEAEEEKGDEDGSDDSAQTPPAGDPQESQDDPPDDPTPTPTQAPTAEPVNSSMLEQVEVGGDMREHLEEGGEGAIRGLIAWLEAGAKEDTFDKAGLVQDGDPSAKEIIADCCISCHNPDGDNDEYPYAEAEDAEPQYDLVYVSAKPEGGGADAEVVPDAAPETAEDPGDDAAPAADDSAATDKPTETETAPKPKKAKPIDPPSVRRLIHITHAHILAIPAFTFIVGALFMFTGLGNGVKLLLGPLPMLAVMLDIGGWWLARWIEPFIYVIAGAGALFGITYALQILCILCSIWCGRKEDPAATT